MWPDLASQDRLSREWTVRRESQQGGAGAGEPAWRRVRLLGVPLAGPLLVFVLVAGLYAAFAGPRLSGPSEHNHFVFLADAWLAGQLNLRHDPPHGNDWASWERITLTSGEELRGVWQDPQARVFRTLGGELHELTRAEYRHGTRGIPARCDPELPAPAERVGREQQRCSEFFVSFPPMPAVLMLPGVALRGFRFNDVWFTLLLAALSAAALFHLLERLRLEGETGRTMTDNALLTAFFAAGSVHLWCSVLGQVWFTALVVGVLFTTLYVQAAWRARSPFWAGVFLAGAFASRTPLLFSVVLFALFFLFPGGRLRRDWGRAFWRDGLLFAAAPLVVGVALMLLNHARFESLGEFGHTYLAGGQFGRIREHGLFNGRFVSLNLTAMFTLLPRFSAEGPWVQISRHGLALWFTMPALLWACWPRDRQLMPAAQREHVATARRYCWFAVLAVAIPHIWYQNTGWEQFSYRFAMDYLVYLVVLLAFCGHRLGAAFRVALAAGVLINAFGAVTFGRMPRFYANWLLEGL